jgi:hypothetical protein
MPIITVLSIAVLAASQRPVAYEFTRITTDHSV